MRRTAVLALAAATLAACSDRITSPDAATPAQVEPSLSAAAAAGTSTVAPIMFVLSQPRVIGTVPGGWGYFRYPNRPDAELGAAAAVWQYRDDPFSGPMHVMRAPLSTGGATELATVDYATYPTASEHYTAWQSSDSTVMVMENAGGRTRQLAAPRTAPGTLRLVGDQLALVRYTTTRRKELVVYDLAAGTDQVAAQPGSDGIAVYPDGYAFDGRYAAFVAANDFYGIVVIDTRTGTSRVADPNRHGRVSPPSIDAGRLVYSMLDGGTSYTYVQDLATGATRVVSSATSPVPLPYPSGRLRQTNPRISGNLVVWTDTRRDSSEIDAGYPTHTDVYLYDLASGTEMPVSTAPGWSGDARVSGSHLLWTRSRDGAGGQTWELATADVTPVSVPVLLDELKKMEAAGTVPADPLGHVLETFLTQAQSRRMGTVAVVAHLRQFATMVHRNAGTRIDAAAAQRLEGIANGIILRMVGRR
jgi:hypothetical protein